MTFLELFASAYMTPQEVSTEAGVPLATVYHARNGQTISERDTRRIVRAVNSRRETPVNIYDLPKAQIQWE
jgi:hypothetical protein